MFQATKTPVILHGVCAYFRVDMLDEQAARYGDAFLDDPDTWARDFPNVPPTPRNIDAMLDREARRAEEEAVEAAIRELDEDHRARRYWQWAVGGV